MTWCGRLFEPCGGVRFRPLEQSQSAGAGVRAAAGGYGVRGRIAARQRALAEALAVAPLGKLGIQRRYGSLGSGGQQVYPVHLVRDVDVPVPKEVGKLRNLHPTREPADETAVYEAQRHQQSSERICVEHANAEHKQWRTLQRYLGRREDFDETFLAVAGLVSDRAAER